MQNDLDSLVHPMIDKIPISVVVPVKNEEANLARCLARLKRFSEVIVVDSASTDRTREIAREHGVRLVDFAWDGKYPKKRNWLLLNHRMASEWVLFLDADELVDAAFCDAAQKAIASGMHHGYWLSYTNYFHQTEPVGADPSRGSLLFSIHTRHCAI